MKTFSLNVDSPDKVARVLSDAADAYRDSASELASAWQDRRAGAVWNKIARELDASAARIASIVQKEFR